MRTDPVDVGITGPVQPPTTEARDIIATSGYPMILPVQVPVGRSRVALVDPADHELVAQYQWYAHVTRDGRVYARTGPGGPRIYMHRLIAGTPDGFETDHRDGNGLDNRRSNLRTATPSQNRANGPKRRGAKTSRYRGVHWARRSRRWIAVIKVRGTVRYLGAFTDEVTAARAYDTAARDAFGAFARPNLPKEGERGHV
jgi:hypothetical protein